MTSTSAGGEQQDYIGKNSMDSYEVKKVTAPVNWETDVPGSKSITNRALLLAALCREQVRLQGVLFSDDSRHFLSSLQSLGYEVQIDEAACAVEVHGHGGSLPVTSGEIHVGSAGTAARFLTAMLGVAEGTFVIQASEQMKKRPMKPCFRWGLPWNGWGLPGICRCVSPEPEHISEICQNRLY